MPTAAMLGLNAKVESARQLAWMADALHDSVRGCPPGEDAPMRMQLWLGTYERLLSAARDLFPGDPAMVPLRLPRPGGTTAEELAELARELAEALCGKLDREERYPPLYERHSPVY